VVLLALVADVLRSAWWVANPGPTSWTIEGAAETTLMDLQAIALVIYLVARSGRGWAHFGLSRPRWKLDGVLTGLIFFLDWGISGLGDMVVTSMFSKSEYRDTCPPEGGWRAFLVVSQLTSGFAQELVMRGYLIPRLETLLRSTGWSLLLSSVLFASYHVHQGPAGCVSSFLAGLVYGSIFAITRRVWPLALAHAAWNILHLW